MQPDLRIAESKVIFELWTLRLRRLPKSPKWGDTRIFVEVGCDPVPLKTRGIVRNIWYLAIDRMVLSFDTYGYQAHVPVIKSEGQNVLQFKRLRKSKFSRSRLAR